MRILVIDDDSGVRKSAKMILDDEGYHVETAGGGPQGLEKAGETNPDIILCDVRMPEMGGLEFLDAYREEGGTALVVMITAYGSMDLAVEAMSRGAYDYLSKPFGSDELLLVIKKAEEREKLHREVSRLREQVSVENRYSGIVAQSAQMKEAVELAEKVARHPTTVLITGESGTGKELIARLLHEASPRKSAAFVAVNCGAIPDSLLESELFGHRKGAFTGATREHEGMFERAHQGTLFLDEIAELPPQLQVKLLRVLQEGEVRPVGASEPNRVDVRVVAATARDLESEVEEGKFRSELYYRINVARIHLPPLRHRTEDIPPLVKHFVANFNRSLNLRSDGFAKGALKKLIDHEWPGNVRELENFVERALIFAEGDQVRAEEVSELLLGVEGAPTIRVDQLPPDELSVKKRGAELEKKLIARALEITDGNRTRAADLLDLSDRALRYKIDDYDLD